MCHFISWSSIIVLRISNIPKCRFVQSAVPVLHQQYSQHAYFGFLFINKQSPPEPLARYAKLRVAHAPGMPKRFPCHRGLAVPTRITTRAWRTGSLTSGFLWNWCRGNIPGACATRHFAYLVRGPLWGQLCVYGQTFASVGTRNVFRKAYNVICMIFVTFSTKHITVLWIIFRQQMHNATSSWFHSILDATDKTPYAVYGFSPIEYEYLINYTILSYYIIQDNCQQKHTVMWIAEYDWYHEVGFKS